MDQLAKVNWRLLLNLSLKSTTIHQQKPIWIGLKALPKEMLTFKDPQIPCLQLNSSSLLTNLPPISICAKMPTKPEKNYSKNCFRLNSNT